MRRTFLVVFLVQLSLLSSVSHAEIYKCLSAQGLVTYLNKPCPKGHTTVPMGGKTSPSVPSTKSNVMRGLKARFDLESIENRLPPNFVGHLGKDVADALSKVIHAKKGEFETSAQFEARRKEAISRPYLGSLTVEDNLLLTSDITKGYGPVSYKYDADAQKATVKISVEEVSPNGIGGDYSALSSALRDRLAKVSRIELSSDATRRRDYTASNAMGASISVRETNFEEVSVGLGSIPFDSSAVFEISPSRAQELLPNIKILFEVKLIDPYLEYNYERKKPTFDSPSEITRSDRLIRADVKQVWLFSSSTGEVLAKLPIR